VFYLKASAEYSAEAFSCREKTMAMRPWMKRFRVYHSKSFGMAKEDRQSLQYKLGKIPRP